MTGIPTGGLPPKGPPQPISRIQEAKEKLEKQKKEIRDFSPKPGHGREAIQEGKADEAAVSYYQTTGAKYKPVVGHRPEDKVPAMVDRIKLHREPTVNIGDHMKAKQFGPGSTAAQPDLRFHFLTDVRDYLLKQKLASLPENDKKDLRIVAKLKEEANEEAYKKYMDANINAHLYDPGAIGAEMQRVLKYPEKPPIGIDSVTTAWTAIQQELATYHIEGTKKPIFSDENIRQLKEELTDVMLQYKRIYPEKTWVDAYNLVLGMTRAAAYQMYFDKRVFSGSDHGVLHIFHNCNHGHHMFEGMQKHGDGNDKVALLGKIIHFYHDIGYSVGSAKSNFDVMKDHPFIGAKFIRDNAAHFEDLLGTDETTMIERSILNHAIVAFDSDTKDLYKMIRFTTSNSDACAVTADQKTQSFWKNNPETILELAKLRMFITIFPETSAVLGDSAIIKTPEVALKPWLVDPNLQPPAVFAAANFKEPIFYKAYQMFDQIKTNLLKIASKQDLPPEEQEAFKQAIMENFNALGADVVLKQYGARLHDVAVVLNPKFGEPNEPKYLPSIDIGPSELYAYLESLYSRDIAAGNMEKLVKDEYGVKKEEFNQVVDEVGSKKVQSKKLTSPVADIVVRQMAEQHPHELALVIQTLGEIRKNTVSITLRQRLNDYVDLITPKENKGTPPEMKDAKGNSLVQLGDRYYPANWKKDFAAKFQLLSTAYGNVDNLTNLDDDALNDFIDAIGKINEKLVSGEDPSKISDAERLGVHSLLTTDNDWSVMELAR